MEEKIYVETHGLGTTTESPTGDGGSGKSRAKPAKSPIDQMIINKYNSGWDVNRIAGLYMIQKSYVEGIIKTK